MIDHLPIGFTVLFLLTVLVTIGFFHYSTGKRWKVTAILIVWSIVHSILAYIGFYHVTDTFPPRFGLVLTPAVAAIIYGLLPKQREWVLRERNFSISTCLHVVRLPVELTLYGLFVYEMVPKLMTFEGRNYDIFIGITAPIIGWLYLRGRASTSVLYAWNMVGLALVLFIFVNGILSAELPFQQFAFDQPNRAITYFPFILLPATIVPIVIWTHLSDMVKLRHTLKTAKEKTNPAQS